MCLWRFLEESGDRCKIIYVSRESIKDRVYELAIEKIKSEKNGVKYSQLHEYITQKLHDVSKNTIHGALWSLRQKIISGKEDRIIIPERGLYVWRDYYQKGRSYETTETLRKSKEEDFYETFAEYMIEELGECTRAVALGGNMFQDKWSTPDVIGVYKFSELDPIRPPPEIISAEIKSATDTQSLITAFGQACSYRLFSHKVYMVIPKQAGNEALSRLESLCMLFGIGLVVFNAENPEKPEFQIRTRAQKSEPDYFYLNYYLSRLPSEKKRELFG